MKFFFDGYDLTLAVIARRTLLYEFSNHSNDDRKRLVLDDHVAFYHNLAKQRPPQVNCLTGNEFQFAGSSGCYCQNLYVANGHHEVAYAGTLFSLKAIACYRSQLRKGERKSLSGKYVSRGRLLYWVIPTQTKAISDLIRVKGLQKFFCSFHQKTLIPLLVNVSVCLFTEEGAKLEKEILHQAKLTAKLATSDEKFAKLMEDWPE